MKKKKQIWIPTAKPDYCSWKQDLSKNWQEDCWSTDCGNKFLVEGSLEENDYKFCPNCGRRIKEE